MANINVYFEFLKISGNVGFLLVHVCHMLKLANKEYLLPDARVNHATDVIWPLESISDVFQAVGCKHTMFWQI
jgi:hypothetical protein